MYFSGPSKKKGGQNPCHHRPCFNDSPRVPTSPSRDVARDHLGSTRDVREGIRRAGRSVRVRLTPQRRGGWLGYRSHDLDTVDMDTDPWLVSFSHFWRSSGGVGFPFPNIKNGPGTLWHTKWGGEPNYWTKSWEKSSKSYPAAFVIRP